ncbi:hypothetical protein M514_10085 [Trichuris suis]|uniref:Uncharacterized protein n=1 Tax=Trichuris suis TaxID=68888 RepID=A0A085MU34_9BILA|nr:hypothetical protein M513_10085 [Trichuris suis]KFD60730.1 hypothetical protein M514_10085 [Trichuris suis]
MEPTEQVPLLVRRRSPVGRMLPSMCDSFPNMTARRASRSPNGSTSSSWCAGSEGSTMSLASYRCDWLVGPSLCIASFRLSTRGTLPRSRTR